MNYKEEVIRLAEERLRRYSAEELQTSYDSVSQFLRAREETTAPQTLRGGASMLVLDPTGTKTEWHVALGILHEAHFSACGVALLIGHIQLLKEALAMLEAEQLRR